MSYRHLTALLLIAVPAVAGPLDQALERLRDGQAAEAVPLLRQAVTAAPDDLSARYWLAAALVELGDWPNAVAELRVVLEDKPTSAPSLLLLARALVGQGRRDQAAQVLDAALRLDPTLPGAHELRKQLVTDRQPSVQDPPGGPRVGVEMRDGRALPRLVNVAGERLYDYTFGTAPTDWEPSGGDWSITSRYACEPEWSFFGGQSRGLCAIWNKRRFAGDLTVEAYLAFKHGLPWAREQWSYVPSDLNITIGAEPGDLASGYSFIYSGDHGRASMIRHGDRVLAETTDSDALLPSFSDANPLFQVDESGRPFGQFHRHWWRLEARKAAGRLQFVIDGKLALDIEDPDPRAAGQVAIWTVGSGLVIARCRIAYQTELAGAQPGLRVSTPAPLPAAGVAAR